MQARKNHWCSAVMTPVLLCVRERGVGVTYLLLVHPDVILLLFFVIHVFIYIHTINRSIDT